MKRRFAFVCCLLLPLLVRPLAAADRWTIASDGGIEWSVETGDTHRDQIEMSGEQVSVIMTYGVDADGRLALNREVVWPMLRFFPNKTRDHLALTFGEEAEPRLFLNRAAPREVRTSSVRHRGLTTFEGTLGRDGEVAFTRVVFPSTTRPAVIDRTKLVNRSAQPVTVEIEANTRTVETNPERGVYGGYVATAEIIGAGERTLQPGESTSYALVIAARRRGESPAAIDPEADEAARRTRVEAWLGNLQLETPEPVLNTMFALAKIRATESIYRTKHGLMHGPGGGAYYAAIWANDQAEYANPFFPFLGDAIGNESALNAFRLFAHWMNPDYRPIPSSIIAEGDGFWNGAGDRGDMAMIAYGAARFALARGDRAIAGELWPLITWCLEYCRRQLTADGVVASDSDELENRFPAGRANLCTSSLYYDALNSAADLARELDQPATLADALHEQARAVRAAIENYFGATVEGFATYRYFDKAFPSSKPRHAHYANEPDHLRAWICVPLTVGIDDRAAATADALFSPRLWTDDGLATQAGEITFWDRSTLYALRGVFAVGDTPRALDHLMSYSRRRLLGEHVPYPVEAYPEGNQRHLAAESALYCRIFTEGMFGIRPTGLRSFDLTPRLPSAWDRMALKRVHAFGVVFGLAVTRRAGTLEIDITREHGASQRFAVPDGGTVHVGL